VTALYELELAGAGVADGAGALALKYQTARGLTPAATGDELLTLKLRHTTPDGMVAPERELAVRDDGAGFEAASGDLRFAAAVAAFGMLLRDSPHRGDASWDRVLAMAGDVRGARDRANREEFLALVRTARELASR
jgi:Ca-activated chloride channel family protein